MQKTTGTRTGSHGKRVPGIEPNPNGIQIVAVHTPFFCSAIGLCRKETGLFRNLTRQKERGGWGRAAQRRTSRRCVPGHMHTRLCPSHPDGRLPRARAGTPPCSRSPLPTRPEFVRLISEGISTASGHGRDICFVRERPALPGITSIETTAKRGSTPHPAVNGGPLPQGERASSHLSPCGRGRPFEGRVRGASDTETNPSIPAPHWRAGNVSAKNAPSGSRG